MSKTGSWSCEHCNKEDCASIWLTNEFPCPDIVSSSDDVKEESHKPPMHLILWKSIRWLIRIRVYGSKKYPKADNWKDVQAISWYDACLRHLAKWSEGEQFDAESGLPHLAHALCNLCYLIELTEEEAEF